MITFESVTKRFADGTIAADDLNFEVPEGESLGAASVVVAG